MKRLIQFMGVSAILWTLLTITACSSDDDNDKSSSSTNDESALVGNWFYFEDYDYCDFLSLKKDGSYIEEYIDKGNDIDYEEGTWETKKSKLYLHFSESEWGYTEYNFTLKGNSLTLTTNEYGDKAVYKKTKCKSLEECLKEMD